MTFSVRKMCSFLASAVSSLITWSTEVFANFHQDKVKTMEINETSHYILMIAIEKR